MTTRVFLSYSLLDSELANEIAGMLEGLGLKVVNPTEAVSDGTIFQDTLREAIKNSDAMLVVGSADSLASSWVNYEAGMADALGKKVVVANVSSELLPVDLSWAREVPVDPNHINRSSKGLSLALAM